jgi:hypothetical protein
MKQILMWLSSAAFLFFGARMTWFMGQGAVYLMHRGAFDAIGGFVTLLLAPLPFLVCGSLALLILYGDEAIPYDDQDRS